MVVLLLKPETTGATSGYHKLPCVAVVFFLVRFISERELIFMFAICRRPSVCLSSVCRLSVCRLSSVTFVHPTQAIEIFGNVSTHLVPWPSVTFP